MQCANVNTVPPGVAPPRGVRGLKYTVPTGALRLRVAPPRGVRGLK